MPRQTGLNVLDAGTRVIPALRAAPTSVAGFVGLTRRGIPGRPVRVTDLDQFTDRFGGHLPQGYLPDAVTGFFRNGGRVGYVVRVTGAGTRAAAATLADRRSRPSLRVTAAYRGDPDPGAWAEAVRLDVRDDPAAGFRVVVRHRDTVVEDWRGLTMDRVADRLNHPRTGSRYVRVAVVGDDPPSAGTHRLTGGADGTVEAGDLVSALSTLDIMAVRLVAVPDAHLFGDDAARVARHAIDYCAARGDCVYVGSAPDKADGDSPGRYVGVTRAYAARLRSAGGYGALYAPWLVVPGTGGTPFRTVPPDGHVLGVYARTEQERGVFRAPAGEAAAVRGALAPTASWHDLQHDLMTLARVNGIRDGGHGTPFVAASTTLSTDPRWRCVGTRLLFNHVKATLRDGLRFVSLEPHTEELRRTVRIDVVTPFLLDLWRQGAFGSGSPGQVFTIKCDAENNPPSDVEIGDFRVEIALYPHNPAETVRIVVGQQPAGGSAAEL